MAKRLSTEERLKRLAEEAKKLKAELKKEKSRNREEAYRLIGEALYHLFQSEEGQEGKRPAKDRAMTLAEKHLTQKKRERLEKLLQSL